MDNLKNQLLFKRSRKHVRKWRRLSPLTSIVAYVRTNGGDLLRSIQSCHIIVQLNRYRCKLSDSSPAWRAGKESAGHSCPHWAILQSSNCTCAVWPSCPDPQWNTAQRRELLCCTCSCLTDWESWLLLLQWARSTLKPDNRLIATALNSPSALQPPPYLTRRSQSRPAQSTFNNN